MTNHGIGVRFNEADTDAIFRDIEQSRNPGVSVGIGLHGRPLYRKGFGLANMEAPLVLTPSTRMRIASTSKHFTCLAYMLLCEERLAGIDDPVGKYIPEVHPVMRAIPMRDLMANTGGLRDANDLSWQFSGKPALSADVLTMYENIDDVAFRPRTAWSYNNGGFILTGIAVERITDKPLEEVLHDRIFAPVGMYDTALRRTDTGFQPNSASAHMTAPEGGYQKYTGSVWGGDGGIVSTSDDLLRWLAHMKAPRVGTPETWALMKASIILANGTSTGYGLGLISHRYRGLEILFHAGGGQGVNAQMLKAPALGLDVVVLSNRHDVSAVSLVEKIIDTCVTGLEPADRPAHNERRQAVYRSPRTGRVVELAVSDAIPPWVMTEQQVAIIDGVAMPVELAHQGWLKAAGSSGFSKIAIKPTAHHLILDDYGNIDELEVQAPPSPEAISGSYDWTPINATLSFSSGAHGTRLFARGPGGTVEYRLQHLGRRVWRAQSDVASFLGGIIEFAEDGASLTYSSYRNARLRFVRR